MWMADIACRNASDYKDLACVLFGIALTMKSFARVR